MNDSPPNNEQIERIRRTIEEVRANRAVFSDEAYIQIVLALDDKLRAAPSDKSVNSRPPTPAEDEIRLVTVMFIDVMNSTKIVQKIGNEDWHTLIGEAHRHFAAIINRWDGEIGQYLGDGLLCFFGARRSWGNDAARSVSCALAIQEEAAQFSFDVQERYKIDDFTLRVGISTGRVIVGMIGTGDKSEVLAVGTTTNLAARLQTLCPPGGVAVDAETYRRSRQEFQFSPPQTIELKGFEDVVEYYLVTRQAKRTMTHLTTDRIGAIVIPFVNRKAILDTLIAQMHDVERRAVFHAFTLYGEIGLGKSRLLQEIIRGPVANRFFLIRASGHYEQRDRDYSLLRDAITNLCDLSSALTPRAAEEKIIQYTVSRWDHPSAEASAAVVGYLTGFGFVNSPYAQSLHRNTTEAGRVQIHQWVRWWLQGISEQQPILLLLDNLQWADSESLALLESLSQIDTGLILIGAARPEFKEQQPLYMRGVAHHTEQTLAPFDTDSTQILIDSILSDVENVPPELYKNIHERAEGNPLFVEEFLRMLFDNNVFEPQPGGQWQVNHFEYRNIMDELPSGLLGVFQARIDDLSPEGRRSVQAASVVGQTFWSGVVSHLTGFDALPELKKLVQRGFIIQLPESRLENEREYTFRNTLYHDVAYSMLTRSHKTAYHIQVAGWLNEHTNEHPEMLGLLARHYEVAEQSEQALTTYVRAANYHIERGLLVETLVMVDAGLSVAREVTREIAIPLVSKLWLIQGRALHSRRRYSESTAASQSALRLLEELPDHKMRDERVLVSVTLGNAHTSLGNHTEALDALNDAYQRLDEQSTAMQRAAVLRAFGQLFLTRGSLDEATLYLKRSLLEVEQSGNASRERAAGESMIGRIALDKGQYAQALTTFENVLSINISTQNYLYQVMDLRQIATVHRNLFAYDIALQFLTEAEQLCERINYDDLLVQSNRGLCYIGLGQHSEGLHLLQEAINSNSLNVYDRYEVQLDYIEGLALCGQFDACIAFAARFTEAVKTYNPILYARGLLWLGLSLYKQGGSTALATLQKTLDYEDEHGGRYLWICHYALSIVCEDHQPDQASHQRQLALESLHTIADTFDNRPTLQAALLDPANPARLFSAWLDPKSAN